MDKEENLVNLLVFDNMYKTKTRFKMNKTGDVIQVKGDIPSVDLDNIKYDRKNSGLKFRRNRTENCVGGEHKFEKVYLVREKDLIKSYKVENCWLNRTVTRFISFFEKERNTKSVDCTVHDYKLNSKGQIVHKSFAKKKLLNGHWVVVNK